MPLAFPASSLNKGYSHYGYTKQRKTIKFAYPTMLIPYQSVNQATQLELYCAHHLCDAFFFFYAKLFT